MNQTKIDDTIIETETNIPQPFPQKKAATQIVQPVAPSVQNQNNTQTQPSAQTITAKQNTPPSQTEDPISSAIYHSCNEHIPYQSYLTGGGIYQDIEFYQKYDGRKTGYSNLDDIQSFLPGLYMVGAVPSLGKTTCFWQMANQIAKNGEYVLFFSLEQTQFELASKALSHEFYKAYQLDMLKQQGRKSSLPKYTSVEIRCGAVDNTQLNNMIAAYMQSVQDRIRIIEGAFISTVEDICKTIKNFIEQTDQTPTVIIDYLQIIAASNVQGKILDTRANIDYVVKTLKSLQMEYGLTMIVISSLNRQNYMEKIDFESFKESGSLEYTCDVVWGLQFSLLSETAFYYICDEKGNPKKETSIKQKRDMLNKEKAEPIRSLQMVYIKNRYGQSGSSVLFNYVAKYDTFIPKKVQ